MRRVPTAGPYLHTQVAYSRLVEFIEAPAFTKLVHDYLAEDPQAGALIPGTGGFRCGEPLHLPRVNGETVRETRQRLGMSRSVFAYRLGINLRTMERWEQGRSLPNEQAAALILLVRRYPDTLDRLASLGATA